MTVSVQYITDMDNVFSLELSAHIFLSKLFWTNLCGNHKVRVGISRGKQPEPNSQFGHKTRQKSTFKNLDDSLSLQKLYLCYSEQPERQWILVKNVNIKVHVLHFLERDVAAE